MIDPTAIRATLALQAPRKKGFEKPLNFALGRNRGGLTAKIHMVCAINGVPLYSGFHQDKPVIFPPLSCTLKRMFDWLKEDPRIAPCFEKLANSYAAMVSLACAMGVDHIFFVLEA